MLKFKATKKQYKFFEKFTRDENGSFAVVFGLCASVVLMSAGIAVDYSRMANAKSVLNSAVDAAVLSVGHELSKGEKNQAVLKEAFDSFLAANIPSKVIKPSKIKVNSFSVDVSTGKVLADVGGELNTSIMKIAGFDTMQVGSISEATFSNNPIEISMMLDVTGSMQSNGKIGALKTAASEAVNILIPEDERTGRVKIGLVPYATSVNAGRFARKVKNESTSEYTGNCVTGRSRDTFNDVSYEISPLGGHDRAVVGNNCPKSKITPLTTNREKLLSQINKMSASGYTAGHLGIAWSYYMLSEKWQALWGRNAAPSDYSSGIQKVAILMTDGSFNTYFEGTGPNERFGGQSNKSDYAARELCKQMKKKKNGYNGIKVYSIAFDAPRDAQKTLKNCASPADETGTYYYSANSKAELKLAFQEIAISIKKLTLSR